MKTPEKYKLVYVVWEDSIGCPERWERVDDIAEPQPSLHISTGFLIRENKDSKIIAPHISFDDEHEVAAYTTMGYMTIPNSAIRLYKEIEAPVFPHI